MGWKDLFRSLWTKDTEMENDMFLIVGLGNPGKQYEHTRHNIGFDVMDALAEKYNISISEKKHKALCGKGVINGVIVIYDDISLAPGNLRIRKKGSAGGHNGIKNIIAMTGTQNFLRIKVGVGEKPAGWDLADHVLGHFDTADRAEVEKAIGHAVEAAEMMITGETDAAMNRYNVKKKEE